MGTSPDCFCDGTVPWCPPCVVAAAVRLRLEHPDTLSVSLLKRRIPGITGHEAALLVEATMRVLRRSIAVRSYVESKRAAMNGNGSARLERRSAA